MAKSNPAKPTKQVEKFRETARALECDESEPAFNAALKRVAKAPPPKDEKRKPKQRRPA